MIKSALLRDAKRSNIPLSGDCLIAENISPATAGTKENWEILKVTAILHIEQALDLGSVARSLKSE